MGTRYAVPVSTESSHKTAPSADPREEEILRAAFAVFTEKGFHGATMLDVATRARASTATLYGRFAGKAALFGALVAWGTRQGTEALDAIVDDTRLDPLTALDRFAARLLGLMLQPEKLALQRIAIAEGGRLPAVGRLYSQATRAHGAGLGRRIARRLVDAGVIRIDDAEAFGHSFIGLLQGELVIRALLGEIDPPDQEAIERHAAQAMALLVRAYAPSRP